MLEQGLAQGEKLPAPEHRADGLAPLHFLAAQRLAGPPPVC